MELPTKQDILDAYSRIKPFINRTPVLSSSYINQRTGAQVYFKCQNMQKTGSFKVRGAANTILQLDNPKKLCAHSSGNHAQAVSYVAQKLGLPAYIVMPKDTPDVKKNAVRHYKAEIIESGPTQQDQQIMSGKVAKEKAAELIHPYNNIKVITGAATSAYQLYQEVPDLDYVLMPIGGGGLAGGTVSASKRFSPKTQVIGVQPFLAGDAKISLEKGVLQPQFPPKTLAEGVRVSLGQVNFSILKGNVSDVILITEQELIEAARLFMQRMKIVVQISGALVMAAVIKDKRFKGKRVGAIISGGNIDLSNQFKFLYSKL